MSKTNMEKYYGFKVNITDALQPLRGPQLLDVVTRLKEVYDYDPDEYLAYVSRIRIEPFESFRGLRGIESRVAEMRLTFSVNPKQVRSGKLFFCDQIFDVLKEEHQNCYPGRHIMLYAIQGQYFVQNRQFQNRIVTFVSKSLRLAHRKIKVTVEVQPTDGFKRKLAILEPRVSRFDLPFQHRHPLPHPNDPTQVSLNLE